ncbi:MAG: branched-chain amino acid transporter AzlD [Anaerotruncus colihominis]
MPLTPLQTLAVVLTVAGVTVLCRALPFLLFRDGRPVSGRVIYLGRVAVCDHRDPGGLLPARIDFASVPFGAPEIIAVSLTVAIHVWKRKSAFYRRFTTVSASLRLF